MSVLRRRILFALAAACVATSGLPSPPIGLARDLPPQSRPRERWALFIGRDDRAGPVTPLQQRIVQSLRDDYGYHKENIVELYNDRATGPAVREEIASVFTRMKPSDTLFAYVALKTVVIASDVYFVPHGGKEAEPWTLIPASDFDKLFASFPAQNALVLFPSCQRAARSGNDLDPQGYVVTSYSKPAPARTLSVLSYCAPPNAVVAFGRSLVAAMGGEAGGTDGRLTAAELSEYLRSQGYSVTLTKSPAYSSDEFAFVRTQGRFDAVLLGVAQAGTPEERTRAIDALVKAALSEAPDHREGIVAQARGPLLRLALEETEDGAVRSRAVSALGDLSDRQSAGSLARLFGTTRDAALRKAIVDALTRIGGPEALPTVRRGLSDEAPPVRVASVRSVGYLKDEASVGRLVALLGDGNDDVRIAAVQTAVAFPAHRDEIRAGIPAMLQSPSPDVRREAVSALGALGRAPSSREVIRVLQTDPDPSVRQAAAYSLARSFPESDRAVVESALFRSLSDSNTSVQEAAAWALGEVGGAEAERQLIRTLRDRGADLRVTRAAAESLGRMKSVNAVPSLIELLKTGTPEVKQGAATALGNIGDPRATEPLLAALKDSNAYVRAEAEKALQEIKVAPPDRDLQAGLHDSSPRVRMEAVQKLAQSRTPDAVAALVPSLGDEDYGVREAAIDGLSSAGDGASGERVGNALQNKNFLVRQGAARVLGRNPSPQGARALLAAVKDPDAAVRAEVIRALGKFPQAEAEAAVHNAATDPDAEVRQAAAESLGGYRTPEAMSLLRRLASDPAPNVRSKAVEALRLMSVRSVPATVR